MRERNVAQRAFDEFGRDAGFEKKSGSWYRLGKEVTVVLNLQKSQYGPRYYLNVGFWFCELGDTRYPKDNMCHIVVRLEGLLPAADEQIQKLLDLGREMIDEQRMLELRTLLNKELLPLIERGSSIAGLRQMLADGMLEHAGIRGPAQLLLASTR